MYTQKFIIMQVLSNECHSNIFIHRFIILTKIEAEGWSNMFLKIKSPYFYWRAVRHWSVVNFFCFITLYSPLSCSRNIWMSAVRNEIYYYLWLIWIRCHKDKQITRNRWSFINRNWDNNDNNDDWCGGLFVTWLEDDGSPRLCYF